MPPRPAARRRAHFRAAASCRVTLIALSLGDAYLELKSSPPKHLTQGEVAAFFARVRRLLPDVAVFAMDTALRLSDRVLPLLAAELGSGAVAPRRIERDLWALTPHLYVVSAKPDLAANACRALAEGLLALGPLPQ